jgi:hypothetical protein
MKLIVAGGSGLVATDIIRQSLLIPHITSLIVLSRRPITLPSTGDHAKLKQVIVDNYESYTDVTRAHFSGAHACIWYNHLALEKIKTFSVLYRRVQRDAW